MIFEPGRTSRTDIYENTSAVDILPTMLQVTGQEPADWTEGTVLPPFRFGEYAPDRNVYVVHAEKNEQLSPLTITTLVIRKGDYKLMYFVGYQELDGGERVELYNIKDDPEELKNLYTVEREIGLELLTELKAKLSEMNIPYLSQSQ